MQRSVSDIESWIVATLSSSDIYFSGSQSKSRSVWASRRTTGEWLQTSESISQSIGSSVSEWMCNRLLSWNRRAVNHSHYSYSILSCGKLTTICCSNPLSVSVPDGNQAQDIYHSLGQTSAGLQTGRTGQWPGRGPSRRSDELKSTDYLPEGWGRVSMVWKPVPHSQR